MIKTISILGCLLALSMTHAAWADPDPLLVSQGRIDAIAELIGQDKVDKTMARITTHYDFEGPGSWGFEWRELGRKLEGKADRKRYRGQRSKALEGYLNAQQVYRLGYLPENFRAEERKSWQRFAAVQRKINKLIEVPFVEEVIDVDGHTVTVQLYLPPATDSPPGFVLYTGGVDGSKESGIDTGQLFAAAGYATAAFDLVGPESSSTGWPLQRASPCTRQSWITTNSTRASISAGSECSVEALAGTTQSSWRRPGSSPGCTA